MFSYLIASCLDVSTRIIFAVWIIGGLSTFREKFYRSFTISLIGFQFRKANASGWIWNGSHQSRLRRWQSHRIIIGCSLWIGAFNSISLKNLIVFVNGAGVELRHRIDENVVISRCGEFPVALVVMKPRRSSQVFIRLQSAEDFAGSDRISGRSRISEIFNIQRHGIGGRNLAVNLDRCQISVVRNFTFPAKVFEPVACPNVQQPNVKMLIFLNVIENQN